MDRGQIGYSEGEYNYIEFVSGERLRYKPSTSNSPITLEKATSAYTLSAYELDWISSILSEKTTSSSATLPASYIYKRKTENERNENKKNTRKVLETLRLSTKTYKPLELLELKSEQTRNIKGITNFSGIYIIYNLLKGKYYIGKSKVVFTRAYKHFVNEGNPEIYEDYCNLDDFRINLVPLEDSPYKTLDDFEDNAIRAYESYTYGYNKVQGNILYKPIFEDDNYQKVAVLILKKIKDTKYFSTLSNNEERMRYTRRLLSEHKLPIDIHFLLTFPKAIKDYQNSNRR